MDDETLRRNLKGTMAEIYELEQRLMVLRTMRDGYVLLLKPGQPGHVTRKQLCEDVGRSITWLDGILKKQKDQ